LEKTLEAINKLDLQKLTSKSVKKHLKIVYSLCGYMRFPKMNHGIRTKYKKRKEYKRGWETRFVVRTREEINLIRKLINIAGFKPRKPFKKSNKIVQPVYGKELIKWLNKRN
jgi:hypothetical protein